MFRVTSDQLFSLKEHDCTWIGQFYDMSIIILNFKASWNQSQVGFFSVTHFKTTSADQTAVQA